MKVKGRNGEWGEGELMGKGGACSGESEEEVDIRVEECVSCLQTSLASQGLSPPFSPFPFLSLSLLLLFLFFFLLSPLIFTKLSFFFVFPSLPFSLAILTFFSSLPEIHTLSNDFYAALPHKSPHRSTINSKRTIAQKQDLCQVGR